MDAPQTTQGATTADAPPDAYIYYTTPGVATTKSFTPIKSSARYTGPVSVSNTLTPVAGFALPSGPAGTLTTAMYSFTPAAAPVFSVPAGTYQTTQSVAITDATPGAVIYYTTNGIAPTTSSALYSGPISVTNTMTLRAVAALPNGPAGTITTEFYTFTTAAAPAFSVPAGTYQTTQSVAVTDATPGAVIYYTTNGVAPTTSSAIYSGPISVSNTTTLRAVAALPNGPTGTITTSLYTFTSAVAPVFSLPAGTYQTTQTVTITDATPAAVIYYTTNGVAPTTSSTPYTGPVSVTNTTTLRAVAALPNGPAGSITTAVYTFTPAVAPVFSVPTGTYQTAQSVAITDATPGAAIYYTTNGVAPTTSSTPYTGPISVSSAMTLRAVAALPNGPAGSVTTAVYTFTPSAAPLFSVPAGTYQTTQNVAITDPTAGATIYYTTNGVAPTTSSTPYTGPVSITNTTTLRAVAALPNGPAGSVTTAVYTFTPAAAPVFSVPTGSYQTTQNVAITDATAGATIYYTTNGVAPTTSSTPYTGPVSITNTTTLRAIAALPNGAPSAITTSVYTFSPAGAPVFSLPAGTYATTQSVSISDATAGVAIYYTTNGTVPTISSTVYTGPISVASTMTLKAVAALPGAPASGVTSATYTIPVVAATPAFSLASGTYTTTQTVAITDTTAGAAIYYTTNGSTPTTSSAVYTGPISVASTMTLKAVAALSGGSASSVVSATYTITAATAVPAFSLPSGTYATTQTVAITDTTAEATIYYTTNGTTPTTSSTVYKTPLPVNATMTLKAVAALPNAAYSAIASATYTITAAGGAPIFSLPAGSYTTNQTVAITDTTAGASIYYTTNGVAPTTSSAVYTGPLSVTGNMTLRAIAAVSGASPSTVTTAVYTIVPASAPEFSLAAGTYNTNQSVSINEATPGAVVYYTTSGVAPTTSSPIYTSPVPVTGTVNLRAIAALPSAPASTTTTALYKIAPAASPAFSVPAGTYQAAQSVTISDATPGAVIYYTTSGVAPTTSSAVYTGPVSIIGTTSLRAIASLPNAPASTVTTAIYTLVAATNPVNTPNSSPTFFGMTFNHLLSGTPWPSLPVSTMRLWDTGTLWANQNTASGTYQWQTMDKQVKIANDNGAALIYTFGGTPPWAIATNLTVDSLTRSGGVVTVTTAQPHALYYNPVQPATSQSQITIAGSADWSFNGTFYITGSPSATTLTYAQNGPDANSTTSGTLSAVCSGTYAPGACAQGPVDLTDWDQYVTQLITHVGPGTIKYWELWNEPNITTFWQGDPQQLVTMAEHAQTILKNADPQALLISPGVAGNYADALNCSKVPQYCGSYWLNNWLALGGKNYIDVVGFHGYPANGTAPEQIQGAVDLLHTTMVNNGVGSLPLWDTESSWGKDTSYSVLDDQAGWAVKHLLMEHSMGVQRTFWYAYDNASWGSFWNSTSGQNIAGNAWGEAAKWITGTTLTQPCAASASDATTFTCGYSRADGYVAQAMWNTTSTETVTVPTQFIQYRDVAGTVHAISGGTVEISTSPILLETASAF